MKYTLPVLLLLCAGGVLTTHPIALAATPPKPSGPRASSPANVPTVPGTPAAAQPKPAIPVVGSPVTVPELNLKLVPISPGTFTMGAPSNEQGYSRGDGPQTRVTLSKPFWLGATEVTQAQYMALMGNNPGLLLKPRLIVTMNRPDLSTPNIGEELPVFNVSWNDAMAFCQKLTERERTAGRLPAGYIYTLPTDAQWEYACRAGTTGPHAGKLDEIAWYKNNSNWTMHKVGTKKPNAWGLYDMHGNATEWCLDRFKEKLPGRAVTDPLGPDKDQGEERVYRGGFWGGDGYAQRSAFRKGTAPDKHWYDIGFRVALAPQITPASGVK